ncbi:hypothetical protein ABZX29_18685, partial [Streptomyces zhihengii]
MTAHHCASGGAHDMTVAPGALPRVTGTAAAGVPAHAAGARRKAQPPKNRPTPAASGSPAAPDAVASPKSPTGSAPAAAPGAAASPKPAATPAPTEPLATPTPPAAAGGQRSGDAPAPTPAPTPTAASAEPITDPHAAGTDGTDGTDRTDETGDGTAPGSRSGSRSRGDAAGFGEPGWSKRDEGEIDGVDEALALVSGPGRSAHRDSAGRQTHGGAHDAPHRARQWPDARSVAA